MKNYWTFVESISIVVNNESHHFSTQCFIGGSYTVQILLKSNLVTITVDRDENSE